MDLVVHTIDNFRHSSPESIKAFLGFCFTRRFIDCAHETRSAAFLGVLFLATPWGFFTFLAFALRVGLWVFSIL